VSQIVTDGVTTDVTDATDGPAADAPGSPRLREEYLVAHDAVQRASEQATRALADACNGREVTRDLVVSGKPLRDLKGLFEPLLRAAVSDALTELERSRHDVQRVLFRLLHAEGWTLADIGRSYGISRQLVSRLVNEPDPLPVG